MPRPILTPMLAAHEFGHMLDAGRMPRGLSYRQAYLLTLLAVRPSLTRADYQALARVSANTAQLDLAGLVHAGLIVRLGAGPSCRYAVIEDGDPIAPESPRHHPDLAAESPSDPPQVTPI